MYYKVIDRGTPVKIKNTEGTDDPYIGRTRARNITPPRLPENIRRHLAHREGVTDISKAYISLTIDGGNKLEDSGPYNLMDEAGLASSPDSPIILIVAPPMRAEIDSSRSKVVQPVNAGTSSQASTSGPQVAEPLRTASGEAIPQRTGYSHTVRTIASGGENLILVFCTLCSYIFVDAGIMGKIREAMPGMSLPRSLEYSWATSHTAIRCAK